MQNGFRRLALAQGLLPDRQPPAEASAPPAPNPTHCPATENPPPTPYNDDPERWAISAA